MPGSRRGCGVVVPVPRRLRHAVLVVPRGRGRLELLVALTLGLLVSLTLGLLVALTLGLLRPLVLRGSRLGLWLALGRRVLGPGADGRGLLQLLWRRPLVHGFGGGAVRGLWAGPGRGGWLGRRLRLARGRPRFCMLLKWVWLLQGVWL